MPTGSMAKYFSDKGGAQSEHGKPLHWPGTADGFPHRGPVIPDLRQDEYDEQVQHALDYHSRLFKLWIAEEKKQFDAVMDRIANGWYMQNKRIDRWSDEYFGLVVWLEWVQIYGETAISKYPGGEGYAQPTTAADGTGPFGVVPTSP